MARALMAGGFSAFSAAFSGPYLEQNAKTLCIMKRQDEPRGANHDVSTKHSSRRSDCCLCCCGGLLTLSAHGPAAEPTPLTRVHAHNDYEHKRALF